MRIYKPASQSSRQAATQANQTISLPNLNIKINLKRKEKKKINKRDGESEKIMEEK